MHVTDDLIKIFNDCFGFEYSTRLVRGGDEPLYLPASESDSHNLLYFANGFFSSALHECAHWLLAGDARRKLVDFGYWYVPDGRTMAEQLLFQQVEVKPQALEWVLSQASAYPFQLSIDNLNGEDVDVAPFKQAVYAQVKAYCALGLPKRAQILYIALSVFYGTLGDLNIKAFDYNSL
ncbi:MAG: elongation factor P hydroxylase [Legionella sp.]|nr:elongation factor P hydroxylase [Legionella sp.]